MQKSKSLHRTRTKQNLNHSKLQSSGTASQKKQFDIKLYEKFINFLSRTRLQKLKEKLTYFYGRNFPIAYQDKYNFLEEWQGLEKKEEKNLNDLIQSENSIIQIACLFIMISNTLIVWSVSLERVFRTEEENSQLLPPVFWLGIVNRIISAILRLYLEPRRSQNGLSIVAVLRLLAKDILCVVYYMMGVCGEMQYHPLTIFFQIYLCYRLYSQARKYYKYLKIIQLMLIYQYQFKIFDLMSTVLILTHFLSIFMYFGVDFDRSNNWIIDIHAEHQSYFAKYLYSLYFCSTTILTIGYGDITPKNKLEIAIVIIVQFLGVIIFGYLISEIGHTLSIIRKNEETLQKDLTTLKKIEGFYNIQSKLVNRAKGYLVSNQNALVELTPDEENNLLSKLNEQLRAVIINQKSLSIVKNSIFFLCRWSKEMQNNVANKLQKALYAPNERLLQPVGKQRIYIIKRGKIDIYCDRYGHNRHEYRRLMKSIKIQEANQIRENIYGYTAVFSLRPSALDAVSSEFTSCYFIEKNEFQKCVNASTMDFQYYHEIKSRIDHSQFCEAYEAPSILNIREHYNPSRTIVIRKNKVQLSKLHNDREPFLRSTRKGMKKHCFQAMQQIIEQINDKLIYNSNDFIEYTNKLQEDIKRSSEKSIDDQPIRQQTVKERKGTHTLIRTTEIVNLSTLNWSGVKTDIFQPLVKKSFHHYFERARQYKNFFCSNNITEVIQRLENENYNFNKKEDLYLSFKNFTNKEIDFGFHHN